MKLYAPRPPLIFFFVPAERPIRATGFGAGFFGFFCPPIEGLLLFPTGIFYLFVYILMFARLLYINEFNSAYYSYNTAHNTRRRRQ
jgi:hypothetical protein